MWAYSTVQKIAVKQNSKHKSKLQRVEKNPERSYRKNGWSRIILSS
jgi:hypothetical protein